MNKRAISFFLTLLLLLSAAMPAFAADNKPAEPIWDYYAAAGSHTVTTARFKVKDYKCQVWYPSDLAAGEKCPVIVFGNPTSYSVDATPDYYQFAPIAASHGYMVLTNTDKMPGNGKSMNAGLTKLLKLSSKKGSRFYQKVDKTRIVSAGHSQGAIGAVNIADPNKFENAKYIKALFVASIPQPSIANESFIKVPYDTAAVKKPVLMIAGTGLFDDKLNCTLDGGLQRIQSEWKSDAYIARVTDSNHFESMGKSYPYMLAWFDYQLYGNSFAAKAFKGTQPELLSKTGWQDGAIKIARRATLKKAVAVSGGFKAVWKRDPAADGYQLRYAKAKKMKGLPVTDVPAGSASYTVSGLRGAKDYYVRVRSYTMINGTVCYGKWSKPIKVK